MQDRASGSVVEQVILFPPLLESHDMTSWQEKDDVPAVLVPAHGERLELEDF